MTVTFTSRDVGNQVLEGVRHLANRIVVFLKYCVFSCLAELLHLATRIKKIEQKTRFVRNFELWPSV